MRDIAITIAIIHYEMVMQNLLLEKVCLCKTWNYINPTITWKANQVNFLFAKIPSVFALYLQMWEFQSRSLHFEIWAETESWIGLEDTKNYYSWFWGTAGDAVFLPSSAMKIFFRKEMLKRGEASHHNLH